MDNAFLIERCPFAKCAVAISIREEESGTGWWCFSEGKKSRSHFFIDYGIL